MSEQRATLPLRDMPPAVGALPPLADPDAPRPYISPHEAIYAGFQLEHSLASYMARPPMPSDFPEDPGYEPDFMDLQRQGYDAHQFTNARSQAHEDWIKESIDGERKRRNLADASGWGLVGQFAGALSDPFMTAVTVATGGSGTLARIGWRGLAVAEMGGAAATEAALQATQMERTAAETAINIAASGIVTGAIGAMASEVGAGYIRAARRKLAEDMRRALDDESIPDEVRQSLSADYARLSSLEEEGIVGFRGSTDARLLERFNIGPLARLLQSPSVMARRLGGKLADSSFMQIKGLEGKTSGTTIEALHRDDMGRVDRAVDEQSKLWKVYAKRGAQISKKQFNERVARAMRNDDLDPEIDEISQAAQFWRKQMEPVYQRALQAGELVDDWTRMVDATYRTYNKKFDADIERYGKGIDLLTETYFKAYQRGLKEVGGVRLTKRMRDQIRKRISGYIDENGFEGIATPASMRALAKHIDDLVEGRFARPDTGPAIPYREWPPKGQPLPPGTQKEERAIATAERIRRREADYAAFADEVSEAFGELQRRHDVLLEKAGLAPDPTGVPGRGRLTRTEFEERVGRAFTGEDIDPDLMQAERIRGASIAWRKGKAKASKMDWREVAAPQRGIIYHTTAASYFPRVPDRALMLGGHERFHSEMVRWMTSADGPGLDLAEAEAKATNIVNGYLNDHRAGQSLPQAIVGESGHSKGRVVPIPDNVLEPWLVNDPATVLRGWSRSLGTRSALVNEFGDREMSQAFADLVDDYENLRATPDADAVKLDAAYQRDREDLIALRDRLAGHYGAPTGAEKWWDKTSEHIRLYNMLAMLGGAGLSSITDISSALQKHGLRGFSKGIYGLLKNLPNRHEDLRDLGVGLVYAHNTRFAMLSDVDLTHLPGWQQALGSTFLHMTGLTTVDTIFQRVAGYSTLATMERWTKNYARLSKVKKARLARVGIGEGEAELVANYFSRYGPEVRNWPDPRATGPDVRGMVRRAVQAEVDWMTYKPGVGDPWLFMSGATGKTVLQFKQFGINATNRMLIAGLQQGDANWFMGLLMSATLGALLVEIKARLRGKKSPLDEDNAALFAVESLGRAGWYGVYEPFKDLGVLATGNMPSRFAAQNLLGAAIGPTGNQLSRASGVVTSALSPDSEVTYRQIAPLVPLANALHLRDLGERLAGYE